MKEYLFSYGTLQKDKIQLALFGRISRGWADRLASYKVVCIEFRGKAFLAKDEECLQQTLVISKDNSDEIEGTVFEITTEEMLQADKYEPDNYKRTKVVLQSGKDAWIYTAVVKY